MREHEWFLNRLPDHSAGRGGAQKLEWGADRSSAMGTLREELRCWEAWPGVRLTHGWTAVTQLGYQS